MGLPIIPPSNSVSRLVSQNYAQDTLIAPKPQESFDRLKFMPSREMAPLIYLSSKNVHFDEKFFKVLTTRGGSLD